MNTCPAGAAARPAYRVESRLVLRDVLEHVVEEDQVEREAVTLEAE